MFIIQCVYCKEDLQQIKHVQQCHLVKNVYLENKIVAQHIIAPLDNVGQ